MSSISAQYSKEIETLRYQLSEARKDIESNERNKIMAQENLKKAFMKGVCAMNMEAMTILNPSEQSNMEQKFESMAEGVLSQSTPVRQLAFNSSNTSDYKVYDSNLKEGDLFNKFGIQMSEANESEKSDNEASIHHTPNEKLRANPENEIDEKEIKPERNAYTELETASMSKLPVYSSGVKIHKPGDDIIINNTKIESKDSQWKPAPVMQQDPIIVNNVKNSNFGYNSNSLSFNEKSSLPKSTLGMNNGGDLNCSNSFMAKMGNITREQNNNDDLIETLTPKPHMHPGASQPHYQSISNINEKMHVVPEFKAVKENISSNVIDSIPSTVGVAKIQTNSTGGKTIRVNSR